ncbi:hypothetical protein [Mariniblastus fucicola]|nr:hypothetical protein [Mariniblastus fucicola]
MAIANGQPTFGDVEIENHQFRNSHSIRGRFWSRGAGTNQSRLELILGAESPAKLTQVCDGRFLYRLTEHNGERKIKFISLEKLDNQDASIVESTLPAGWVGTGSIDSLFKNLSEAFKFAAIHELADAGQVELTGTWKPEHLAKLMINRVDHREIMPSPDWSKLPPQFPHGVRLRFKNTSGNWYPSEVMFIQFDTENGSKPKPMISIKFGPLIQQSLSAELFQIDADETGAVNETELYNERIDLLTGKQRVAEEAGNAIR